MGRRDSITLGIDAGGTFTDLVLFDSESEAVIADTKISTHHEDMLITLDAGVAKILEDISADKITAVNLATTFATNAIVENRLRPVRMLLIGYTEEDAKSAHSKNLLGTGTFSVVTGGHSHNGSELAELDEDGIKAVIENLPEEIEGIAISGYFSIRNPAHEIRAKKLIASLRPDLHITCGHELTWELNAFRRAATASLNAGLIPIIIELIEALIAILKKHGITAPLTVVRGDGTAVGESWAKLHPVEMLLSGPASSAVGAGFLAQQNNTSGDMWICDIGGTTTDIIALGEDGRPQINKDGATVGTHRTLVKSIDIFTFGQGGDSRVSMAVNGEITIGPLRILPICVLAEEHPEIVDELENMVKLGIEHEPLFILPNPKRPPTDNYKVGLFRQLVGSPKSVYRLSLKSGLDFVNPKHICELAKNGYIDIAGFTPTDAFHVLGTFNRWNTRASVLAAQVLTSDKDLSAEAVAERVQSQMVKNIALEIFGKRIENEYYPKGASADVMQTVAKALTLGDNMTNLIKLQLNSTLVGAGAPSRLITEAVAEKLNCPSLVADKAEVAGAVGAAVGTFAFSGVVLLSRPGKDVVRVHHPQGIEDFRELEEAVVAAEAIMRPWLTEQAKIGGVAEPEISISRRDVMVAKTMHMWTELHFTVT